MHKRNGQSYRMRTHTHAERIGCKFFLPHLPSRYHICFRYTLHMSAQSCSQHRFCMLLLSKYILICARQNSEKSKYVVTSSAVTGPAVHMSKKEKYVRLEQGTLVAPPCQCLHEHLCEYVNMVIMWKTYNMVSVYTYYNILYT